MLEDYLPGDPGPRVGALRLAEEPRGGAARQREQRPRPRCASLVTQPSSTALPRLRRLRGPAPAAPQGARRGAAPRRRAPRARQRRQALAAASARSSSSCSCCRWCAAASSPRSHALDAEGLVAAGRQRADEAESATRLARAYVFLRRVEHRIQYLDDQQTTCCPPATATSTGSRAAWAWPAMPTPAPARPPGRDARVRGARVRRAAARRRESASPSGNGGCKSCGTPGLPIDSEAFAEKLPPELAERVRHLCKRCPWCRRCATRARRAWRA